MGGDDESKPPAKKRPSEDRDKRQPKNPPAAVAEQIARPSGQYIPIEITGEESLPITNTDEAIVALAKSARAHSKDLHAQAETIKKLEQTDDLIKTDLNTLKVEQRTTGEQVYELRDDVGKMRMEFAEQKGLFSGIKEDVATIKRISEHKQTREIDEAADKAKARREAMLKFFGILAILAGAAATAITAMAKSCG